MTGLATELRARLVADIRRDLAFVEDLPDGGTVVATVLGSEAAARQVMLDLTPAEQARVRLAWLLPQCDLCSAGMAAVCGRCAGPACATCDVNPRSQTILCEVCEDRRLQDGA